MKRRDVLASLGGLGTAGLAGCLAGGSDESPNGAGNDGGNDTTTDPGGTTTDPENDDGTTTDPDGSDDSDPPDSGTDTPDEGTGWGPETEEPFERLSIGTHDDLDFPDNNRPHTVRVWNDADEARSITLSLHGRGDVVLERTFEYPADGWVKIRLVKPASYEFAVAVEEESAGTVDVDRTRFDCNGSWTSVVVNGEGAVDSTTGSTMVACPGPEAGEPSFSQGDGECGSGGEASVEFAGEAVNVAGTVRTPTPCHDLALESADLRNAEEHSDGTDDVLVVTVTTDGTPDGPCTDCIGAVDYEATVPFEHQYPSNVRVVHSSMDEDRTVHETSR